MTELQKTFLLYTLAYFLIKGGLFVGLYVALVMVEKDARARFAKLRIYLQEKRRHEEESWSTAYRLFQKREAERKVVDQPAPEPNIEPVIAMVEPEPIIQQPLHPAAAA